MMINDDNDMTDDRTDDEYVYNNGLRVFNELSILAQMNLSVCKFIKLFKILEKLDHLFVVHLQKEIIFYKKYVREEIGYELSLKLDGLEQGCATFGLLSAA